MIQWRIAVLTIAVLMAIFVLPASRFDLDIVKADTGIMDLQKQIDNKNQEIDTLEAEIKKFQGNIDEAENTASTLSKEILRLNSQVKQLNAKINLTQKKISEKELEIKSLGLNISDTKIFLADRQDIMGKLLKNLDQTESEDYIQVFLKYNSLSDFFNTIESTRELNQGVKQNYEDLKQVKTELENEKTKAETAKKELANLKRQLMVEKEIEQESKTEKATLLKETKNQEVAYQKLLRDREIKRAEIYDEIKNIENQLKKKIDLGTLPSFGRGILLVPIDGGVVTQGFGHTNFSIYNDVYKNGFHNGVDIRAPIGTIVRATENGRVMATGNADIMCPRGSYGKWIVIDHPNNLATLYAHLSLVLVTRGQAVHRGDIIGYSGNTGYTTGPHLHFTVYDARTVELRQSRVCGVLPYGGYLNPLNYL